MSLETLTPRRSFLWKMTLAMVGSFAGCIDSKNASETTTPSQGSPSTISVTSDRPTSTSKIDNPHLPYRLRIRASVALQATIILTNKKTKNKVYAKQQSVVAGKEVILDKYFSSGVDYRLVIEVNENRIFDRLIFSYESYILSIQSEESVNIVEHVEI